MKDFVVATGLLVSLLFLMGCSVTSENVAEDETIVVQVTKTVVTPTLKVSLSPTSLSAETTKTATSTIQPTLTPSPISATATPTPYPTFDIAFSTLSEEAATQHLIELLETNRECELPCWWGIVPGETNVNSMESTFVPLGFDWNRDYKSLTGRIRYPTFIYFTLEDNIVQSIEVHGGAGEETYDRNEAWRPYAIPQVLERLGQPEEVYVYYPFLFDPGGMRAYHLFLYYPDLGVQIDYIGKAKLNEGRPQWAQACPNILETDEINLFLFQPTLVPDYLEQTMPETSLGFFPRPEGANPYDMVSWEQATESSIEDFVRLFRENEEGSVCFDFKTYWTGN